MTSQSIEIGDISWKVLKLSDSIYELYPPDGSREVIYRLYSALRASGQSYLEIMPAFDCLAIQFAQVPSEADIKTLSELNLEKDFKPKEWKLEVCFELGLDMERLVKHSGLSQLQIIHMIQQKPLTVAACGFLPGFVYFDGLDPKLHFPRRKVVRPKVAEGYFAIGGEQAGIYGVESPGGWNLIGKSPHNHFDPKSDPPMPFEPGDLIHIESISQADYDRRKNG
jgi:KipI family sensor histidine kinase inhibitor